MNMVTVASTPTSYEECPQFEPDVLFDAFSPYKHKEHSCHAESVFT
jgi:hypothetical protein